jgi:hypothetical protein
MNWGNAIVRKVTTNEAGLITFMPTAAFLTCLGFSSL